jgi:hypothetical protein
MAQVNYVSKNKLYPAFGKADPKKKKVYIRNDLPKIVKKFVKTHEVFHIRNNKPRQWFWEEIKANTYAGIKHPIGFIVTILMSLQPYRIKLYIQRFKEGK